MDQTIYWVIIFLSCLMSYSIGANDAANALGTSYGSDAAKLIILLILGAIFELVGAVWCSSKVAGTLADTLLPTLSELPVEVQERLMLGVCLAAFSFILVSSIFGMPISGTHTVIGALIGAGLAGIAFNSLNWTKFGMTVASWFISPVLSSILTGILFLIICAFTLEKGLVKSPYWQLQLMCLLASVSLAFSCYMVIFLVLDEPTPIFFEIALPTAFSLAWIGVRFFLTMAANHESCKKMTCLEKVYSIFGFWSFSVILNRKTCYKSSD